jgi:two-component system cell cycle response regulator DivK
MKLGFRGRWERRVRRRLPTAVRYTQPLTASAPYILVVDDSTDGREMVAEYLTFRGFAVVEALSGSEAVELAKDRPPALILMDLQMPGVTGWDATRALRADPRTRDAIILAVTAHAMKGDAEIARAAGCDGFIAKPFDIKALGDAVAAILRQGREALEVLNTPLQPLSTPASPRRNLSAP